ncbi:MAG: hypothetical protein K8S15_11855 [Candidatus Aegiribacteria sp.]|nr:hypothetical protein [Candidatus Aegiribacteria sp.]
MELNSSNLAAALNMLGERLRLKDTPSVRLVACGGSALIAMGLVFRTTDDVDVVALVDAHQQLISPAPFPEYLEESIKEVAILMNLSEDWMNYDPSRDSGGLFQNGLPEGLLARAHRKDYGSHLITYFIDRIDQIHFKVFASADRLGVHVDDLVSLNPSNQEMENAARWCMTHDPSEGFRMILISMYEQLGYSDVAERL